MARVDDIRAIVDGILASRIEVEHAKNEAIHIYGVSMLCTQLALKRGLDPELAAAAGMLHDIYRCRTGLVENHAHNGEEDARTILRDLGLFTSEEQTLIRKAIFRHSGKAALHDPYDELLKDADVLQRYLYDTKEPMNPAAYSRLARAATELGLPTPRRVDSLVATEARSAFSRLALAKAAEELASRHLVGDGNKSGPDVYPLLRYFPGATPSKGFDWCASFVYHCCRQAALVLPIRYPGVSLRFAAVPAWLEWAKLPEIRFFHAGDAEFTPERGDLVIFDRLVSDVEHDHIGIVLEYQNGVLTTAEGNVDNRSGIFQRDAAQNINGYVRIADGYRYKAEAMEPTHIR